MLPLRFLLPSLLLLCSTFPLAFAYSSTAGTPTQCDDFKISWSGMRPPLLIIQESVTLLSISRWNCPVLCPSYTCMSALISRVQPNLPDPQRFGSQRNISIPSSAYANGVGSFSVQLPFPEGKEFVLTMSDSTGFGSGGSTELLTTGASLGGQCNSTDPGPAFDFSLDGALLQCE